jgi:hypothetical protein
LRQPVEASVDFAEFLAGQRGFALDLGFPLAASRGQFITVISMARSAAQRRRLVLFRATPASARGALVIM